MPLEIQCPHCRRKFRVPEKYAGKRVKCPKCEGTFGIPAAKQPAPDEPVGREEAAPEQAGPDRPAAQRWYLQTEEGQHFGPASREELDDWLAEGRIDASCQVLCEGWEQWKWADEVFPDLAETPVEPQQPEGAVEENPFAGIGEAVQPTQKEPSPYVSPRESADGIHVAARSDDGGGEITPRTRQALAQTRPWLLLLSILMFIAAGLGAILTLLYVLICVSGLTALGAMPVGFRIGFFLIVPLMMGGATLLCFFAACHLFKFGSAIAKFLRSRKSRDLERAMIQQKSFWTCFGILGVVAALIAIIGILILLLFPAVQAARNPTGLSARREVFERRSNHLPCLRHPDNELSGPPSRSRPL